MVYYNVIVNIYMCYGNPTIVNMYWYYRKLVYKIIVNRGGYRITYFVVGYWIASPYICYHFSFFLVADVWRSNDGKALERSDKLG